MSDQNGNSGSQQQPISPVGKKHSIDDIIDHMTADLQSYDGQYILLGSPTVQSTHHQLWPDYAPSHSLSQGPPPAPSQAQVGPPPPLSNPVFLQQPPPQPSPYHELQDHKVPDFQAQHGGLFYGNPPPNRMQDGSGGEMIGMVDMGNGNFVNVVFNTASPPTQIHHGQYTAMPPPGLSEPALNYIYQQSPVSTGPVRDYGLFTTSASKPLSAPHGGHNTSQGGPQANQQLIENLVGNWLPNQSGQYSPFGNTNSVPISTENGIDDGSGSSLRPMPSTPTAALSGSNRKPRAVAEVRPMRPTYSDVLTKSPPPFPPAPSAKSPVISTTPSGNSTPKSDTRKQSNKSNKSGGSGKEGLAAKLGSSLRRQHSSGSEEASKLGMGARRWISMEDLTPIQTGSDQTSAYEPQLNEESAQFERDNASRREQKKQKKKTPKLLVNDEKTEALNNHKLGSTSFVGNKRPLQINNNLQRNRSNIEKNLSKQPKKGVNGKEDSKVGLGSPAGSKRSQRSGKRRQGQTYIGVLWTKWQHYALLFANWFLNLIWDVMAMSARLFVHMCEVSLEYSISTIRCGWQRVRKLCGVKGSRWRSGDGGGEERKWWHFWTWLSKKQPPKPPEKPFPPEGLANNMAIPATGDDAIRRLLSCKGKDPYSILGVTRHCNDEEIKKYYKRQAVLVHPDKNSQPGAEEAFKILVHAFELIGEPERRSRYDQCVAETHQMEHAWTELNDLLTRLHQKMEYTANTIRCTNCGKRHRRVAVQRPCYAARFCSQCKIHHSAREGDIWAESWVMGFVWHYYACMEGSIYNITEWASCQAENLQHLKANSHAVQYRIVLGKQQHQHYHQQQNQSGSGGSSSSSNQQNNNSNNGQQPSAQHQQPERNQPGQTQSQQQARQSEPDFEEFLNNLYSQSSSNGAMNTNGESGSMRQRRKARRKK